MSNEKLKECPFCGDLENLEVWQKMVIHKIPTKCVLSGYGIRLNGWNTRHSSPSDKVGLDECKYSHEGDFCSKCGWIKEPDYETPLKRAKLINEISDWYYKKFKPGASDYVRISVFDLIADFIIDTTFSQKPLVPLDKDNLLILIDKRLSNMPNEEPHMFRSTIRVLILNDIIETFGQKPLDNHDSCCTIYSALENNRITDGICTCGYGKDSKGIQAGNLYSQERILAGLERKPLVVPSVQEIEKIMCEIDSKNSFKIKYCPNPEIIIQFAQAILDLIEEKNK